MMEPPGGRPWALLGLCAASLTLNVYLLVTRPEPAPPVVSEPAQDELAGTEVEGEEPPPSAASIASEAVAPGDAEAPVEALDQTQQAAALPNGIEYVEAKVTQNLARTFRGSLPPSQADVVSAVYARLFFWDLDVRRDLQAGDSVQALFSWDGVLADIPAATYGSGKLGRTLTAYRFQREGDAYPSWWNDEGVEVPRRLKDSPIEGYQQITALLKDRPTHKGMDFKAPTGTEVTTPRAGRISRVNWNLGANGNCIEIVYDDGVKARMLHLDSVKVKAGQRVSKGQVVALSGNTGRSTAPHLHYELDRNGRVLDPVDYHGVYRREIGTAERDAFRAEMNRWNSLLRP